MAKKKNRIADVSSSTVESTRRLKERHSRLVTEKEELKKQFELLSAKVAFIERNRAAICAADPVMAETTADTIKTAAVEMPEVQEEVKKLESEESEVVFQQLEEDLMAEKASGEIGREGEDSVERKRMEWTAYLEERILGMEERFKKLAEAWERRERLFNSTAEEFVLVKNLLEKKNSMAVDLAVEIENRKWIQWILVAILGTVWVAFVANSTLLF